MEEDLIGKKAELILGGDVRLPEGFVFPFRVSRSTAGPGAGKGSAVFAFGRFRVKKTISYDSGEFELSDEGGRYSLTRGGEPFLAHVELVPVVFHCPEQAFFTLDPRCRFRCAFCTSPLLDRNGIVPPTDSDIVGKIREVVKTQKVVAVSLTSGVVGTVDDTVGRFESCIAAVRREFPDMPIGVEPYVTSPAHLRRLRDAGADEMKLNLESPDREIFSKVCPDLDWDGIWSLLGEAVEIFGRGKVTSNIIFGMGETDASMESCMERMCSMGVVPTMRALRTNGMNNPALRAAIGDQPPVTKQRILYLAHLQKEILSKHGMSTLDAHTMCLECTCCDLVPFRDF